MILPFSQKIKDGTPTYFEEKIWQCLYELYPDLAGLTKFDFENAYIEKFGQMWPTCDEQSAKRHTIREDAHDRWHAGRMIHMVVNNRSKNQFRFAPVIPCISVQEIEITHFHGIDGYHTVLVDDHILNDSEIETLAKNDGFKSSEDFFWWFRHDYIGKIIHWTDLKY